MPKRKERRELKKEAKRLERHLPTERMLWKNEPPGVDTEETYVFIGGTDEKTWTMIRTRAVDKDGKVNYEYP